MSVCIPEGYKSALTARQTQIAIKKIKDFFQTDRANQLNLRRVSAPLFVDRASGLNDNLGGWERPVGFDMKCVPGNEYEIVQSLAKWKRMALGRYGFAVGEGLYTDMNAIRRDEDTDNVHSVFVDQWDWEKVIRREDRTRDYLHKTVNYIYDALRQTENYIADDYNFIGHLLPESISFVTSQELEDAYPGCSPKERELAAAKKYGAVFIEQIGGKLRGGAPHDGRAPDYDDWDLNGDLIVYYPLLDMPLELSSMGIRVDRESLIRQLECAGCPERAELPFHKALIEGRLPYTVGGGIGQSRMCMFFLRKAHIGEVQASCWPEQTVAECSEHGVFLL